METKLHSQNPVENTTHQTMKPNHIVSREEWLTTRRQLLVKEKELTCLTDELNAKRRELP